MELLHILALIALYSQPPESSLLKAEIHPQDKNHNVNHSLCKERKSSAEVPFLPSEEVKKSPACLVFVI